MACRSRRGRRGGGWTLRATGAIGSALLLSLTAACSADVRPREDAAAREEAPASSSEAAPTGPPPLRAFTPDSWWNTPVPGDAPHHPRGAEILDYMSTAKESEGGCLRLAGAGNDWGQPVYWAKAGDPEYDVAINMPDYPPEMHAVRIPHGAESADNSDGSMTVFDVERGYTVALTDAKFHRGTQTWSASGATVTYLDSNGYHARTGQSSDPRNLGSHRGNNAAVMMVRFDEVEAGAIEHVLKVALGPEASSRFVFPMIGSDGHTRKPDAPPQGLRLRIKPSVDLDELDLDPQAKVIATALQEYGFYIGDSGGSTALKLEDTRTAVGEHRWDTTATALCDLPFDPKFWDVLPEGYRPSPG